MTAQIYYTALPFRRSKDGHLVAGEAVECGCAESAANEAEQLGAANAGAIAFSREIDFMIGTCGNSRLLRSIGDVPSLNYLLGAAA